MRWIALVLASAALLVGSCTGSSGPASPGPAAESGGAAASSDAPSTAATDAFATLPRADVAPIAAESLRSEEGATLPAPPGYDDLVAEFPQVAIAWKRFTTANVRLLRQAQRERGGAGADTPTAEGTGGGRGSSAAGHLGPRADNGSASDWATVGRNLAADTYVAQDSAVPTASASEGGTSVTVGGGSDSAGRVSSEIEFTTSEVIDGNEVTITQRRKVTGDVCPDAAGSLVVEFEVSNRVAATSGRASGAAAIELAATATGAVNDAASLTTIDIDARQQTTAPGTAGKPVFVDTSMGLRAGDLASESGYDVITTTRPATLNRSSQGASPADQDSLNREGMTAIIEMVRSYFRALEDLWKNGRCVEVVAESPGQVEPGSSHDVKVAVRHKLDGTSLSVPVDVSLQGGDSVSPERIDEAPGSLTYRASEKSPDSATISLVSTSRRGIGKKDLAVQIGMPAYEARGGGGEFTGTGTICSLSKPFTISGGGVTVDFTPKDATSGTYSYSGSLQGFPVFGKGTYTVKADDSGGTLTASGPGTVKTPVGNMTATDTERYTLTPTDPCE